MTSTTYSDRALVEVKNLHVSYEQDHYQKASLRDLFIKTVKSPVQSFLAKRSSQIVLDDICFSLKKGDRLGIIGRNGAGKTTLCRCLAHMLTPQHGEINVPEKTRAIFSHANCVDPFLTGRENALLLGNYLYPWLKFKELEEVIEEACHFSGLGEALETPIYTYSLGMQTRLFLSVVTSVPCDLLILDEVYDGADEHFKALAKERITQLIERSGAVILVSHNSELFKKVCNKVILIEDHKLIYEGSDIDHALALYRSFHGRKGP
jgi:ABC-type polysaccharide/polyol phosphate transport system ATPase subunit